ncbi:MAG: SH3 domain-containing protein [Lachnospiraceae bacterium]|nr:SH3 domain-containing protein [Lachnospiraceae bacterium]
MKKLRKVFTLAATLLVIAVAVQHFGVQAEAYIQKLGTITTDTSLYESASSSSSVVMSLTEGQSVTVNNEVTGTDGAIWYQLYVNSTDTGYVPSSVVTATESSTTEADVLTTTTTTVTTGTITAGTVNVRSTVSTSSTAVTQLESGATFTVLAEETGDDGYVWYQAQFDQNGSTVTGYIRSDLASVTTEEVVTEVETTATETTGTETTETENTETTEDPYRLVSQTNAEGEEIWYLVEAGSSSGYSIDDLLEAATSPASSSSGGTRVVTVVLVILLIIAVAGLAFVFLRWRDAEGTIEELREQNRRRRTTTGPAPASGARTQPTQKPKQTAGAGATAGAAAQNRPRPTAGQSAQSAQTRTQQSVQTRTQQSVQTRTQQTARPAGTASSNMQQPSSAAPRTVTPTLTPRAKQSEADQDADMKIRTSQTTKARSEKSQYEKISLDDLDMDDFPNTDDIVTTTRKELKRKQDEPAPKPKTRKSRNFLDDDDDEDLEFDFLKLDDDE